MNCQEALDLVYEMLDKEASDTDADQFREHLRACPRCSEIYRLEGAVQAFVTEKLKGDAAPPGIDALKSRVLRHLDAIDAEALRSGEARPPLFRLSATLAVAASLVLVVGAIAFMGGFFREAGYDRLGEAHLSVTEDIGRFRNAGVTSRSLARVSDDMGCSLCETVKDFRLTGGLVEELAGTEVAHFVYQNGDQCVSVFVASADRLRIPDDIKENAVRVGDAVFYQHRCRHCRLLYHQTGNVVLVTATTERDIDLFEFVPDIGPI